MSVIKDWGFEGSVPRPPSANLTGSQKLGILADFLEGMPNSNYDQNSWGSRGHSCGTRGCSMGWAGIALSDIMGFKYHDVPVPEQGVGFWHVATGERIGPFELAEMTFGLTQDESLALFQSKRVNWTRCDQIHQLRKMVTVLEQREANHEPV